MFLIFVIDEPSFNIFQNVILIAEQILQSQFLISFLHFIQWDVLMSCTCGAIMATLLNVTFLFLSQDQQVGRWQDRENCYSLGPYIVPSTHTRHTFQYKQHIYITKLATINHLRKPFLIFQRKRHVRLFFLSLL